MPLLNCATAALCGSVHLGKRLGPAFCLILKVFNLWVGNCTKLHWAAIRENVCSGAENFPWSHPGSWCSFVQHSNLFHPVTSGEGSPGSKGEVWFSRYCGYKWNSFGSCCVLFYKAVNKREFYMFECFPVQVSGNDLNYFFCKVNVSLQVSIPQVSLPDCEIVWNLLYRTASTRTLLLMIGSS